MNKFSEIFNRQTKIISLDHYNDENFESFETATDEIIKNFYRDLKVYALKSEELEKKMTDNYVRMHSYDNPEQFKLVDEQLDCERQSEYINGYLDSLIEMKVVYLFKSLELTIKYFIKITYPTIDVKSFFKWEYIKEFFKGRRIDISLIQGYPECVEIKKINNCIKHNGVVNEEIRSIAEFIGQSYLHHEQLELFYQRVNEKVKHFCYALKEKIKDDLYTFSNERLTELADDFYERMDDKIILEFIEKLKGKLL